MAREKRIRGLPYEQWMEGPAGDYTPLIVEVTEWDRTGATSGVDAMTGVCRVVAAVGSSTSTTPAELYGLRGVFATANENAFTPDTVNLSATANICAAVVGKYQHTGTNASTYPGSAVRGEIGNGSTSAYAAFLAVIGGDSASTTATSAYSIDYQNSISTSGFLYGLDLLGNGTHDGYLAPAFRSGGADIRLLSGGLIVSLTTAITANTTTTTYAAGTLAKTTNATGQASLFRSDGTKWQFLVNS